MNVGRSILSISDMGSVDECGDLPNAGSVRTRESLGYK